MCANFEAVHGERTIGASDEVLRPQEHKRALRPCERQALTGGETVGGVHECSRHEPCDAVQHEAWRPGIGARVVLRWTPSLNEAPPQTDEEM